MILVVPLTCCLLRVVPSSQPTAMAVPHVCSSGSVPHRSRHLLRIYYRVELLAARRAMPAPYSKIRTDAELSTVANAHDHARLALAVAVPPALQTTSPLRWSPRAAGVAAPPCRQTGNG